MTGENPVSVLKTNMFSFKLFVHVVWKKLQFFQKPSN